MRGRGQAVDGSPRALRQQLPDCQFSSVQGATFVRFRPEAAIRPIYLHTCAVFPGALEHAVKTCLRIAFLKGNSPETRFLTSP